MVIICKNFTYMQKNLQDMGLYSVDFDANDDSIPLALQKSIVKGETNRYRVRANHLYVSYDDTLEFELHVIKNPETCGYDQSKMKFNRDEVRRITRWLSSSTLPRMLETVDENGDTLNYCGLFTNIETFTVGGSVYGFILTFTNDSPFAYSDIITNSYILSGNSEVTIVNNSDLLEDYCKPVVTIKPTSNTDFYMCNLSDCTVLDSGMITIDADDSNTTLNNFLSKLNEYALYEACEIEFYYSDAYVRTWANNTAMRIKLTERDGTEHYCFAYYLSDGSYKIIEGGFITLKLYADLDVTINCELTTMRDSIDRMVHFKNVGLNEEDYIYWLRLINDENTLLFYGNDCTVDIEYREMIKVGVV